MKLNALTSAWAAALALAAAGGCSQTGRDLTAAGQIAVEPVRSETIRLAWAEVWQQGAETVVKGRLVRRGTSSHPILGHVDVKIIDAGGKVVGEGNSPVVGVRRSCPGKGPKLTPFEVRMKLVPPTGGKVVVAYSGGEHGTEVPKADERIE